ncbi:MAG TPA: DEAD/DEAH box helicase [Gemmatimonadales bacterium]|nr:DEAD/DEAH box helicase [Gemmatimonadales bacterium]
MHPTRDHQLPPDPEAFRRAAPPKGRIIVIAPTRAACETIELALGLHLETVLEREHGEELRRWAAAGKGFGIVAGTGTGKTLAIRPIAEAILQAPLQVGVVNREREATPETPSWNVVVVTTGIARRWFQDDLITGHDTVVVDEIHQTSAELELCLALGKRAGCRFIWLSATVDPTFYARYLDSADVLESYAFDPALRATVKVLPQQPDEFLDDRFMRHVIKEGRGVAVFVPTRAEVEKLAAQLGEQWRRLTTAFYHGGEPIRVIRPFLEGEVERPWLLAMTAAGQSALNIRGLDTVVVYDARYGNVVDRGRNVLHRMYLGANEILQMAGRVHGRVAGGEVYILSDRDLVFEELRPTPPEFQLAGDAERVAITCAAIGVDARDLDLPVPLDRIAYARAMRTLTARGLVENGRLSAYGREVEALPVERPWAELLVHADDALVPYVAVCSNIDSLHRMTRDERDLHGLIANGSDHLTAYNVFAEAVNQHGYLGEVYGLPRHLFEEGLEDWAERRGVLVKAIEDIALGTASVYRALELPLPKQLPYAHKEIRRKFAELLARYMPFDLVIDEHTADGQEARVSKTSVAGTWGAVAGNLRYFADRFGIPRAAIEGTTLSYELVNEYAQWSAPTVVLVGTRRHQALAVSRRRTYFGFDLDTDTEEIRGRIPEPLRDQARDVLAEALVDGETRHPDQGRLSRALGELDELWRRSGGTLPGIAPHELRALVRRQLDDVTSMDDFLRTPLAIDADALVGRAERERLAELPAYTTLRGDAVPLDYEVERGQGVARVWLREGQARRVQERELPVLDRPLRFGVARKGEDPVLAATLEELRERLARAPEPGDRRKRRGGARVQAARARDRERGERGERGGRGGREERGGGERRAGARGGHAGGDQRRGEGEEGRSGEGGKGRPRYRQRHQGRRGKR